MKRRTPRTAFWLAVGLIGLCHTLAIMSKVRSVPDETYRRLARDIRVTERSRYGFIRTHHGGILVKTRRSPRSDWTDNPAVRDDLDRAMLGELRWFPRKAFLEALFYGVMLAYIFAVVPRFRSLSARNSLSWIWRVARETVFWAGGWTLFVAPLLCLDYGDSLYTTWGGPGALAWSGPYMGVLTGFAGETVSYRPFLELSATLPVLAAGLVRLQQAFPGMTTAQHVWLAGLAFYGLAGAAIGTTPCVRAACKKVLAWLLCRVCGLHRWTSDHRRTS